MLFAGKGSSGGSAREAASASEVGSDSDAGSYSDASDGGGAAPGATEDEDRACLEDDDSEDGGSSSGSEPEGTGRIGGKSLAASLAQQPSSNIPPPLTPLKKFVKVVRKTQFIQRLKKQPENFRGISVAEVAKAAKQKILPRYFATEDLRERTFLSEILRSLPVLMHETTWLCDFIALAGKSGHGASSPIVDHVIKTMHVLKVLVARCCWCQVIGHLRDDKETLTAQYDQLKEKFNRCRTEYLIEVAALRDAQQQRVNLDEVFPQTGGGGGHMALFEPLEALHPEEKDYALRAVQEKLKMILERDPCGNLSMNKAQLDSLGKMQSEEEVNELKKHNQELEEALEKFEERFKNIKLGNASNQADKADKAYQQHAELRKENQVLQQQVSELQEQLTKLRRASSMRTSRIDSRTRRSSQAETRKELAAAAAAAVAAVMAREDENDAAALAAAVAATSHLAA
mmetsp:Transcript_100329/g.265184  ORF Transcript_100329/g.265184 Transcript_100329/m.265184 type:complete len:458 (+) Transcript_100329:14-1387(+)